MAILEVNNLHAGYGNRYVIKDISFCQNKGEFISVLGRNGSGKSTMIKALQGFLKYCSGKVKIDSKDISSLKPKQIAKNISYVPQMFSLPFEFSVEEIVHMGRYTHQGHMGGPSAADKKTIEEVMELTEITAFMEKKIANLSGGERQRVFIARALAQNTPILFLDEPSSHLDINYQVEIYQILKRLQEEKEKTILCTEHNINLAIPYSQKIMFLKEGKIHSMGPPKKMITKQNIKEVFNAEVDIKDNLYSGLPEISLIPGKR